LRASRRMDACTLVAILRDASLRDAPQDKDFLFDVFFFLTAGFFLTAPRFGAAFAAVFFAFGRLRSAARWAADSAARAQPANSSESSNSRAGNCQYELTVTDLPVFRC
jgi:hypothetical protein